jgi:hypothetical protein
VDHGAVGSDELGSDEVVAREAVPRGQVADPSAEGESAHAGGADDTSGCHKTERLRRRVELEPSRATVGVGNARVGVYSNGAHPGEVDHEPAVEDAVSGRIVSASTHRDLERKSSCELERRRDVVRPDAARDHRRASVDERVETASRSVVLGVIRSDDGARQRAPQLDQAIP